jgi:hypothetical protein
LGWAASTSEAGVQSFFFHDVACSGVFSMPSHQTSPSSVSAVLVNSEWPCSIVRIAFGLVDQFVPGATPKKPYSGFTA